MAGIEDTPWFVGAQGVLHPAETARCVAYAAAGGATGVAGSIDLKVTAKVTPGNGVVVFPGAVNLVNNYPGAYAQAYIGTVTALTTIQINPTTSAGPRSDLIVARVRDPQYGSVSGYDPGNPNNFNFFSVEVVQNVSKTFQRYTSDTAAYPVMALARIDIPASTGTITNAMITDLRFKSQSKSWRRMYPVFPPAAPQPLAGITSDWLTLNKPVTYVPLWASRVNVVCHMSGIDQRNAGYLRAALKVTVGGISTEEVMLTQNGPVCRFGGSIGGSIVIPSYLRGTDAVLGLRGVMAVGLPGSYELDADSGIVFDVEFIEEIE